MTVPEAIDIAKHHLSTTLPEFSDTPVQLEELETPPYGSKWRFTFSASLPVTGNAINFAEVMRGRRISKSVEIDPSDGALLAVKNAVA
jgi:hypothetical protein